jgi:hypothetical protein
MHRDRLTSPVISETMDCGLSQTERIRFAFLLPSDHIARNMLQGKEMAPISFSGDSQRRLFEGVIAQLSTLDFGDPLVAHSYSFKDSFNDSQPRRVVPIAAFSEQPFSYVSACIAVLLGSDESNGEQLIREHRALGAPLAIEIRSNEISIWRVSADTAPDDRRFNFASVESFERAIQEHRDVWSRDSIARAKRIGPVETSNQRDFFDLGLLPAIEAQVQAKLGPILTNAMVTARDRFRSRHGRSIDDRALFRSVFWLLASKALHDRKVNGFVNLSADSNPELILKRVGEHYGEVPPSIDREVLNILISHFWLGLSFENLSVDVLAYIYEDTLVDKQLRRQKGIHATPPAIARYILNRLPFEQINQDERWTVEPFSGCSTFLVAAVQRLRTLLPASYSAAERHKHFVRMLSGFELDAFSLEVGRLCLTLADLPNPNGWRLFEADVFRKPENLIRELGRARFVTANPPFEAFASAERRAYSWKSAETPLKPARFVDLLLESAHPEASFGLVLPAQLIDGQSFKQARGRLAERFRAVELLKLPDQDVFRNAEHESVVMIATEPRIGNVTTVRFARLVGPAWNKWQVSERPVSFVTEGVDVERATGSLRVHVLREIWTRLSENPTISDALECHRGIEWNLSMKDNEDRLVGTKEKRGFEAGLRNSDGLDALLAPSEIVYLNMDASLARRRAYELPWRAPKIIINAVRKTRGPWRVVAAADRERLILTQQFTAGWPRTAEWDLDVIAAILSGPVVNAFLNDHEDGKHITKEVLGSAPLPRPTALDSATIRHLVGVYKKEVAREHWDEARGTLRAIDARVLEAYELTPLMERRLLDYFAGSRRPVPFEFGDYYPRGFEAAIPLALLDSEVFRRSGGRDWLAAPRISDRALDEALAEVID